MKMNKLLALVDHGASVFKTMTQEYKVFFDKGQNAFKGTRKTYTQREGTADDPSMRQLSNVTTTVDEKLSWYEDKAADYINNTLAVDATNSQGAAKVELLVGTISFGWVSVLELMKLKSLITKYGMTEMYSELPVRSDAEIWNETQDDAYIGRGIFETEMSKGIKRSSEAFEYILEDPNLKNMTDTSRYQPIKSAKQRIIEVGDYTVQHFSGETTQRHKASILSRRSKLLEAIEGAIKEANDTEIVRSELNAKDFFDYLHRGTIS